MKSKEDLKLRLISIKKLLFFYLLFFWPCFIENNPLITISIPKCGTHLLTKVLGLLVKIDLHVLPRGFVLFSHH